MTNESEPQPLCRTSSNPDWWIDPDARSGDYDPTDQKVRDLHESQWRAVLLCYACPYLAGCRSGSMAERHHVWGGLTSAQRDALRNGGSLEPASWDEEAVVESWVGAFLLGASTAQIVETYGVDRDHVATVLGALLADKQALWREEEQCRGRVQFPSGPGSFTSSEESAA